MFEFYSLGLVFFMTFPIFSLVVANYYLNNYSIKPNTKVVCGILSVYIFFSPLAMLDCSNNVQQFSVVFLLSYMMMLSIIDGCSGLLPKELTLSLLILGLIFSKLEIGFILLEESVIGALVNFCIWSVIYHVSNYISYDSLGKGDVWIMTAIGAWIGTFNSILSACFGLSIFIVVTGVRSFISKKIFGAALGPYLWIGVIAEQCLN